MKKIIFILAVGAFLFFLFFQFKDSSSKTRDIDTSEFIMKLMGKSHELLLNQCKPMGVVINGNKHLLETEPLPTKIKVGIKESDRISISNLVINKLRSHGLYRENLVITHKTDEPVSVLYIDALAIGGDHNISLYFRKDIRDIIWNAPIYSGEDEILWSNYLLPELTNGDISSEVSKHVDYFLSEFLKANKDECGK